MTHKALSTCEKYKLLEDGGTVLVALSGGADSTALLHFLYSVKEKYNLTILAAHLNHGIRGEEADRDERFCKILCEKYNIPFYSKTLDIPALSKQRGVSEELAAEMSATPFSERSPKRITQESPPPTTLMTTPRP